jgi:hypothetical protein
MNWSRISVMRRMLTQEKLPEIVKYVQERLEQNFREGGVRLQVVETDFKIEDDWLYVCVTPAQPGVRASDHAELMSRIEKELSESGIENVLLVPTMAE